MEGLRWDCEGRRYETLEDLHAYAARVAATVGVMMTLLMGVRDPSRSRAPAIWASPMQLTNIARDVGEDARAGRLYLPLIGWTKPASMSKFFFAIPAPSPALARVIARLLAEADRLYRSSPRGRRRTSAGLPPRDSRRRDRSTPRSAREVARRGGDSTSPRRARVGGRRKLALLAKAVLRLRRRSRRAAGAAAARHGIPRRRRHAFANGGRSLRSRGIRWRPAVISAGARNFRAVGAGRTDSAKAEKLRHQKY